MQKPILLCAVFAACSGNAASSDGPLGQLDAATIVLPPELANATRVLWVGAHPDDETVAAPLLARICLARGVKCTFLIFTRGEGGSCGLMTCGGDLGEFRTAEMRTSAALFNADVVQWDLGNEAAVSIDDAVANFVRHTGSIELLTKKIGDEISRLAPDAIITFDPRNGVTCHPDHRATAAALIATLRNRPLLTPAQTWMLATRLVTDGADIERSTWIGYAPYTADPAAVTLDVSGSDDQGTPWWQHLVGTLRAHRSQFSDSVVEKFEAAPTAQRTVTLLALRDARENDATYACEAPSAARF